MHSRLVANVLRMNRKPKPGAWSMLAPPVDPLETTIRARAQSLLSGGLIGQCPPLTLDQARDVLRWAGERIP
jgi:hypothetical protein